MPSFKWLVLWSLWAASLVQQPTPTLRVSGGELRGAVAEDGSHYAYMAVPYATIRQRFQAPGPEPTWNGVFEAIEENVRCPQALEYTYFIGQKDCLTLNIYTPLFPSSDPLPVMVYIHGGGFFQGSGSSFLHGPVYLVNKGVIVVTINYRLNIQGFLCLGIKEAPGNAGMKDQVAALKWVKRNIKVFGGDPNNVSLFGESAGGSSVSYHLLSPMSKGLFHKAIIQSGSSIAPWSYQFRPVYMASLLARYMGYVTQDPHDILSFYMNKTDKELIFSRVPRKDGNLILSEVLFVPCTEEKIDGEDAFLTDLPYDVLETGNFNKVPIIIGSHNEEGLLFANMENDTVLPKIDFEKSLPKDLVFNNDKERKEVANALLKLYIGNDKISKEAIYKISKYHGEPYFLYPALEQTSLLAKKNEHPVYSYIFSYNGWRNIPKLMLAEDLRKAPGATHADDIFYLFSQIIVPNMFEDKMINRLTTMWTNFAKYGDPTPQTSELLPVKWLPVDPSSPHSLVIDDEFSSSPLWYSDSLKYWRKIYRKYRRKK